MRLSLRDKLRLQIANVNVLFELTAVSRLCKQSVPNGRNKNGPHRCEPL